MVMMKTLNPSHNQIEPLTASMKKSKIAFGLGVSKRGLARLQLFERLPYNSRFLKGNKQCLNN